MPLRDSVAAIRSFRVVFLAEVNRVLLLGSLGYKTTTFNKSRFRLEFAFTSHDTTTSFFKIILPVNRLRGEQMLTTEAAVD